METKQLQENVDEEIDIHESLDHKNIVKLYNVVKRTKYVCIVLELCKNHSLMEMHEQRGVITDYECRFYIYQILQGVKYLHDNNIIHRDLKLDNLFLNDKLNVKIGDFGLATRIEFDGEKKTDFCGSPKYIAPEMLKRIGHSFEVDVWSIGCIIYMLLVGKCPFKATTQRETFNKIKNCEYEPASISSSAAKMIMSILQVDPEERPSVRALLQHDFIKADGIPDCLPSSCLSMAPRADEVEGGCKRDPLCIITDKLGNTPKKLKL